MKVIDAMYESAAKKSEVTIKHSMKQKILLVDDEKDIVEFLEYNLDSGRI